MAYKNPEQNSPRLLSTLLQRAAPPKKFRVVGVNNKSRQVWDYGVYSSYREARRVLENVPDPECVFYIHNSLNRVMDSSK